ncbi:LysR family transcriptional regulator [Burkholderia sp. JKS000303]|uniref:LysR family transcriptional regulator n=1 Tax=Burkholderia sp. JKS000303 TaxID=1938747 RepID=UPI000BF4D3D9|nr:LysR family transcriptional regulator [Burkholderia sp. JKS000303]PFH28856.1 LysR family transcriptional regulator [Burkholderia sp. JKS000303]
MELLNDMALFVEVVKARGFRSAAQALGMPNSTLSRRIGALEKAIGLRLLHRTTRRIELTEAGQLYFERCKRIVDDARLAHEQLGEWLAEPTGVLRASFPVDFAVLYLTPLIVEFANRYPQLTFDFELTSRRVDLVSEPFDVAIRMGESADSQLVARRLATFRNHLYASPRYLERAGEPREPDDLRRHECLSVRRNDVWVLNDGRRRVEVPVGARYNVNSVGMIRQLAVHEGGIVRLPEAVVADDVAAGRLRRVLPGWEGAPVPVYAMTETRLLPAKTQHFIAFLRAHFARE